MRYRLFYFLLPLFLSATSLSQVSLQDKIGQMIMVGFSGTTVSDSLKKDLQSRNLGGVVLFASNVTSPAQLKTLTNQLKSFSSTPLMIGIDQEGGKVARLGSSNGYQPTNSAYKLGTLLGREDSTRYTASLMAGWLYSGGVNLNLAPVLDVITNPLNPVIAAKERSFSSDPAVVVNHARWFRDEFKKKGIITAYKHFPGHGSSQTDSHLGFTDVTNSWVESELTPYRSLINSGEVDIIMAGHIFNKNLDTSFPASISEKTITGLLRDSLKFNGVVISDELFMKAIADNYTFDYAVELCIKSGTDILLFSTNMYNKRSLAGYLIENIYSKIQSGVIKEELIHNAYNRIMKLKNNITTGVKYVQHIAASEPLLVSNYPNPFNSSSTIRFSLPKSDMVTIKVFDALGREVTTLLSKTLQSGVYSIVFEADRYNLSSSVYYYQVATSYDVKIGKMLLLK